MAYDVAVVCLKFLALVALTCDCATAQCVKTVRWSDDPPYAFKSVDGSVVGINSDIAREALSTMNCEAKFLELPWARALKELEVGRLDILPGALRTPEREKFAYFSQPVNRSPNVLFVSKTSSQKHKISSLANIATTDFRLGAQIGVSYGPEYDNLMNSSEFASKITQITARRNAWKMIELDRLDGIIADETTGLIELQQLGLSDKIIKTNIVVSGEPAMFALSKMSIESQFSSEFNRGISTLMADGRYKRIREKYVPCIASVAKLGCR